jgi:hypothetical protein
MPRCADGLDPLVVRSHPLQVLLRQTEALPEQCPKAGDPLLAH